MRLNSFLILASLLECAGAQTIAHPALGYAYDPGLRAIRAVAGIPGAALLADPLDIGFPVAAAAIAPRRDYALVVSADENAVRLVRWNEAAPSVTLVNGAMTAPDRFAFSPSGAAAVLYNSQSGALQLVTGLPGAGVVQDLQNASAADAVAIADDGVVIIAGAGVRVIGTDRNSAPLPLPDGIAAVAFDRSSHDLLAVSRSGDVYFARNVDAGADIRQIYSADSRTAIRWRFSSRLTAPPPSWRTPAVSSRPLS